MLDRQTRQTDSWTDRQTDHFSPAARPSLGGSTVKLVVEERRVKQWEYSRPKNNLNIHKNLFSVQVHTTRKSNKLKISFISLTNQFSRLVWNPIIPREIFVLISQFPLRCSSPRPPAAAATSDPVPCPFCSIKKIEAIFWSFLDNFLWKLTAMMTKISLIC